LKNKIIVTDETIAKMLTLKTDKDYVVEAKRNGWGYPQYLVTNERGTKKWLCPLTWGYNKFKVVQM